MRWLWLAGCVACGGEFSHTVTADLDAPPELVWDVLVDFDAYVDWNPWIIEAEGIPLVGEEVSGISVLNDDERAVRHEVTEVDPSRRFCWKDLGWFVTFAEGRRCRDLVDLGGQTELTVSLVVTGSMTGTVEKRFGQAIQDGMAAEMEALAERVEELAARR